MTHPSAPAPLSEPAPARILLVDDDEAMRRVLEKILSSAGYGLELHADAALGEARHTIMNRRISVRVYGAAPPLDSHGARREADRRWMSPRELERAAIPTLTRKIAAAAGLSE